MTKVTVFEGTPINVKKKPIQFIRRLYHDGDVVKNQTQPRAYDNVCLVSRGSLILGNTYDVMLAWDEGDETKYIFLGYWNDGVVE